MAYEKKSGLYSISDPLILNSPGGSPRGLILQYIHIHVYLYNYNINIIIFIQLLTN